MNVRIGGVYFWAFYIIISAVACQSSESDYNAHFQPFTKEFADITGYNLLQPSETFILPEVLREISGLTVIGDTVLACIQDEMGTIFFYSLKERKIVDRLKFGGSGDYEGIEIFGNQAYVLKSNGRIYVVSLKDATTITWSTPLKAINNAEGLAYDSKNSQLLIACKGSGGLNGKSIEGKAIYAYHLSQGFNRDPVFLVTSKDLESWNDQQTNPIKLTKRKKAFMPSGIAVHPETKDIYLIATVGKLLIVLDPEGFIKHCVPLSPRVFRQPEGICFTTGGDLIISNEGPYGSAKIQLFKRMTEGMNESHNKTMPSLLLAEPVSPKAIFPLQ